MVRTFVALRQVQPGFVKPEEVQTFRISVPDALIADADAERVARLHQQIGERLSRLPGVTSVGMSSSITMDGGNSNDPIFVENRPQTGGQMPPLRRFKWIGPGYIETMGNHLVAGRAITWSDIYQVLAGRPHLREPCARVLSDASSGDREANPAEPK